MSVSSSAATATEPSVRGTYLGHSLATISNAELRNNGQKVVFFSPTGAEFKLTSGRDENWEVVEEDVEDETSSIVLLKTCTGTYAFPCKPSL